MQTSAEADKRGTASSQADSEDCPGNGEPQISASTTKRNGGAASGGGSSAAAAAGGAARTARAARAAASGSTLAAGGGTRAEEGEERLAPARQPGPARGQPALATGLEA